MGRKPKSNSNFFSLIHPIFTVVVLSAFVLGISFFVKTLATSDTKSLVKSLRPILSRLHIDEARAGQVAGDFASRLSQTGITKESASTYNSDAVSEAPQVNDNPRQLLVSIAVLSDTHDNLVNLEKALNIAKDSNMDFIFFLGDYTNYGEIEKLTAAKGVMDKSALAYLSLPGDHDLYKAVGSENFIQVFGKNHFAQTINGVKFVGLDNSANFTMINDDILSWFKQEVSNADFILLSQPLYHPTFNVVMGVVSGEENTTVRNQALEILNIIRESNAKAIIAGDQHLSSQNLDPQKDSLSHIVVGALTDERNLQTPRFSNMHVYDDGTYQIEDVLIK